MASNARRSRRHNQSPARKDRPPNPTNGLASRATDSTQSQSLLAAPESDEGGSGALRELLSDPLSGPAIVAYLAVGKLLLQFYFNAFSNYGYFWDELYYIDVGKHLDWGYVDPAPLVGWMARLSRELMGDSVFALRFFPAVAGALTIVIVGLMARELGGGRFAQGVSALAAMIAPVWLGAQNMLSLVATEPVWWGLCAYLLIRIIKTGNTRLWIWFGVFAGIGLLNKLSMLFLGAGVTIGLLLTPQRKYLFDRWAVIGGLAALGVASPYILWQIPHGWPTLLWLAGMKRLVTDQVPSWVFVAGQVLYLHPLNFPIWLAGLGWFLVAKDARSFRVFGWAYLIILGFLLVTKSKIYYLAPVYPFLLAGGAVAIERWVNQRDLRRLKLVLTAVLVAGGLVVAPMMLPVLPLEKTDAYITAATLGLVKNPGDITYLFHGARGGEHQAKMVAEVFHRFSPEEQADCIIFAGNYREAAALDFYGPAFGLPPVCTIHQNYYFWGPPAKSGNLILFVGLDQNTIERYIGGEVQYAGMIAAQEIVVWGEQSVPVCICRKPRVTLKEAWPNLRKLAFLN
jgi:hypothetical protein